MTPSNVVNLIDRKRGERRAIYRRAPSAGTAVRIQVQPESGSFFTMQEIRGGFPSPGVRPYRHANTVRIEAVTRSFHPGVSQIVPFRASEWPLVTDRLRIGLQEAVDSFIEFVDAGANIVGN